MDSFVLMSATDPLDEVTVPEVALMLIFPFRVGTLPVIRSVEKIRPVAVEGEEII